MGLSTIRPMGPIETIETKLVYWRRFGETNYVYDSNLGHAVATRVRRVSESSENSSEARFFFSFDINYDVAKVSNVRLICDIPP
jgi:hypothetical protein